MQRNGQARRPAQGAGKKYRKSKTRIFLLVCMAAMLPMGIVMLVMYSRSKYALFREATDISQSTINLEVDMMDAVFSNVEFWSGKLAQEEMLQQICEEADDWQYQETVRHYQSVRELFRQYAAMVERLNVISNRFSFDLYVIKNRTLFDSQTTFYNHYEPKGQDFLDQYEICSEGFAPTQRLAMNRMELTRCYDIRNEAGELVGILAANVSSAVFENYYNEIQKGLSGDTIILNEEHQVLLSSDSLLSEAFTKNRLYEKLESEPWQIVKMNGEERLLVQGRLRKIDAVIYVLIPTRPLIRNIQYLKREAILLALATMLAVILITRGITKVFYRPISVLKEHMRLVQEGKLSTSIVEKRKDDLQEMYDSFNGMTARLEELVNEVAGEKTLNEQMELRLLQAKINPHFLYNTFDSIYSIAKLKKVDQIADMVAALSRFFRMNLSGGENIVPLRDALEIARSYLIVQNIRFGNKIHYEIRVEEALFSLRVPKLLFQPIVENSVYHGLERKKGQGSIVISAAADGEFARIAVQDDGVGMSRERLEEIRNSLYRDTEEVKYYAMRNLARQMRLYYKEEYSFTIESEEGSGTCVVLRLPFERLL